MAADLSARGADASTGGEPGGLLLAEPVGRWASAETTVGEIQRELRLLWANRDLTTEIGRAHV